MANKSVYQEFDDNVLSFYGINTPHYTGVHTPSNEINKVLSFQDNELYNQIIDKLTTTNLDEVTFKSKKKGFLLPGSPVTLPRVKAALKEHKVLLTNDYEEADFIITHDKWYQNFSFNDCINITAMSFKFIGTIFGDTGGQRPEIDEWCKENRSGIFYDKRFSLAGGRNGLAANAFIDRTFALSSCPTYECNLIRYAITGMALDLAWRVDHGMLDIVDVNSVIKTSSNRSAITLEAIQDIRRLVSSNNDADIALAAMILPTIDPELNKHYMWTLYETITASIYKFNRIKDVQNWLKEADLFQYKISAESLILNLEESGELDKESFMYLESFARKDIQIYNRELYSFKAEIKPEFKKYLQ